MRNEAQQLILSSLPNQILTAALSENIYNSMRISHRNIGNLMKFNQVLFHRSLALIAGNVKVLVND